MDVEERISTQPSGYMMSFDNSELDWLRFEYLADQAWKLLVGNDLHAARDMASDALGLWRGPAFADAGYDIASIRSLAERLTRGRLALLESRLQIDLDLGRHAEVISELSDLVAGHPYRERLREQLMLALYRSGRQVDALHLYQDAFKQFRDELGIEPGRELQRLHQEILSGDVPVAPHGAPRISTTNPDVPRTLPRDVTHFTGRAADMRRLDDLADVPGGVGVITAVAGTAGVGKTALAVHWGHSAIARFPDGQLYVNLRGFDPTGTVMAPAEAIRRFLDALNVPPQRIPTDPDAQIDLYRTLLADKRMLVVLDNARDPDQVRPLLPGAPGCMALVTSRSRLTGLIAADGAHPLPLDLLTPGEARGLLARRLGPVRISAEPEAVEDLITYCARLPLALAIVAAHAAAHSHMSLTTLADQLRLSRHRLDALSTGDTPAADVRAVFSWSYQTLSRDSARLFRLLGLHPGPDISTPAAASLAALPIDRVRSILDELTTAHLVTEHTNGRYTFHDLLRVYTTDLVHTIDPEAERHAAVQRMLDHYLHTAHTAARLLNPHRDPLTLTSPHPGTTPEHPTEHQQALDWFATEHAAMLAAVDHAAATRFDTHTWQLAWTLWTFLYRRGHWYDLVSVQLTAVTAAVRLADLPRQARAHRLLAQAYDRLGRLDDTHTHLRHALDLTTKSGDLAGQADTYYSLAHASERQGRNGEALEHAQQALDLCKATGHRSRQAAGLNGVGWYHTLLGDHQQALAYCQQALTLLEELGDRDGQASTWDSLGYAHRHLGHHRQALTCYQHAIDLFRDLGDRYNEAEALTCLGDVHHSANNPIAARHAWQQALAIFDDLDHPDADPVRTKLRDLDLTTPEPRKTVEQ